MRSYHFDIFPRRKLGMIANVLENEPSIRWRPARGCPTQALER